jgi:hypothetical protein
MQGSSALLGLNLRSDLLETRAEVLFFNWFNGKIEISRLSQTKKTRIIGSFVKPQDSNKTKTLAINHHFTISHKSDHLNSEKLSITKCLPNNID